MQWTRTALKEALKHYSWPHTLSVRLCGKVTDGMPHCGAAMIAEATWRVFVFSINLWAMQGAAPAMLRSSTSTRRCIGAEATGGTLCRQDRTLRPCNS